MAKRTTKKAARLLQIEQLLLAHPAGITRAEIARRLGVHRSTIKRDIDDLEATLPIWEDREQLGIDRDSYLTSVRLTLHESVSLHRAARLMTSCIDKHDPHAASALRKLGEALHPFSPHVSQHLRASAEVMDGEGQRRDPVYLDVLETLSRAWSQGQMVRLWHRYEGRIYEYLFAPYFIEPYAAGQTTHVIGLREPPGQIRTLKLERIARIELLKDRHYEIPADFDAQTLLKGAWGIWFTEQDPVEVVIRFHPHLATRLRETRWHLSERLEEQEDGYLLWSAQVAEPQEMVHWIRGWGADAEVLAPSSLKETMRIDAIRLARLYEVMPMTDPALERLLRCWGKAEPGRAAFHPALFHMLDVGHVACELLSDRASPRWRRVLAEALGAEPDELGLWLPWFVSLHDNGKLSAAFQMLAELQKMRLLHEGFSFGEWRSSLDWHHTLIGQVSFTEELSTSLGLAWPPVLQEVLGEVIGGHHGQFAHPSQLSLVRRDLKLYEPPDWAALRLSAAHLLQEHLIQRQPERWPQVQHRSAAVMSLTGFTILCDWLGSDSRFFPSRSDIPLADYVQESRARARQVVEMAGFFPRHQSTVPASFAALFPDYLPERPLQATLAEIPAELLASPCLAIIEAPTGEGKTETAETLAHQLAQASGSNDLYYALPTTATSNQMFGRVQRYIHERLGLNAQTRLIHGQAFLVEDDLRLDFGSNANQDAATARLACAWFTPKKRALLASVGVGTIDQIELAALNVRHSALRLIGLAGKVVILDEVHAYDTYMTTIVERLLQWLAALGSSVIVLSATLPAARRASLIRAYGLEPPGEQEQSYPSLWLGSRHGTFHATPPAYQPERELHLKMLHFAEEDTAGKAAWLLQAVEEGGCVCWIANTVERTQQMMRALYPLAQAAGVEVDLIHARLPLEERQRREQQIAAKYGPDGQRPLRGIVIGTQVLEQSLDLDFDGMVSDFTLIDLLFQRAGRLHRHSRPRPVAHKTPLLWINLRLDEAGEPIFGVESVLYAEYLLRLTWQVLAGRRILHLPRDYRPLIEAVYDETPPNKESPLWPAWQTLRAQREMAESEARLRLLPEPGPDWSFCAQAARLTFEEDESRAAWIVAQTRLGAESLTVIPLERVSDESARLPDGQLVPLQQPAPQSSSGRTSPGLDHSYPTTSFC